MRWNTIWRVSAGAMLLLLAFAAAHTVATEAAMTAQGATPPAVASCETATPFAPTPTMDSGDMAGMEIGTPAAEMTMETEFDQLYIDMMLPHHGSIIAMAQAALPRLTDPRLQEIAKAIIDAQTAEQEELRGYRDEFYGSPEPAPLDEHTMEMMSAAMPGMGAMDEMMFQMDASAQVAAICAAEDADLALIDLVIPHHEMAVAASETALTQAVNPEIVAFAQRVIADQSAEIDELTAIRAEIAGGTPQAGTHLFERVAA